MLGRSGEESVMSDRAPHKFPSTRWATVRQAGERGSGGDALRQLLLRYMAPLRAYLTVERRFPADQAEEFLQGFIADKVLEREILASASPDHGRFRTFLLVALSRYVADQMRAANRKMRSPNGQVTLHDAGPLLDPNPGPSEAFELAWARQVLANTATQMQRQCEESNRKDIWTVFEGRVLSPALNGAEPVPYEQLVSQLGMASVDAAVNLVTTAKRMFARSLRGVVGEYIDEGEVEQEIADLRAILARGVTKSR
jgi:hypothetical protein